MVLRYILSIVGIVIISVSASGYAQQKVGDFNLSNFRGDGTKDWEMRGKEAFVFDEYVDVNQMQARHYRQDRIIDIKADKGMLYKPQMDAYLRENVEIHSDDGAALYTDSLTWKKDKNLIYTDDPVRLARNSLEIEARGMNADTEMETVDFTEDVTLMSQDEETGDMITVQCQGPLEVDYNRGVAVFKDQVRVESERGLMFSDKATVYFNADQQNIMRIIAEGNVKIVQGENITLADKATYVNAEQRLVLEGTPHLIIFPDETTGN